MLVLRLARQQTFCFSKTIQVITNYFCAQHIIFSIYEPGVRRTDRIAASRGYCSLAKYSILTDTVVPPVDHCEITPAKQCEITVLPPLDHIKTNKQTDYVLVRDAHLNSQNNKPPNSKGVVDHAFEVWRRFAQCRRASRNAAQSVCLYASYKYSHVCNAQRVADHALEVCRFFGFA